MITKPYLPDKTRVYAVGDIHGGLNLLKKMMGAICDSEQIQPKKETVYLVFLGDYVDRGENSKQVVDYLLTKLPNQFKPVFIKGNHEDLLLKVITNKYKESESTELNTWYFSGGINTIKSYMEDGNGKDIRCIFPDEHISFFENLQLSFELGEYFFCHAGVFPGVALDQQVAYDLLWIRGIFLDSREDHGKIVVHGHSPCTPLHHGNRISLDHGSVTRGKLAAVRLEEDGSHDILIVSHDEKWRNR
ncbi:MAG: serine/threonine protein phosphatase [Methylococcales bacterium]|nr:serine/threonine protein phosphatase [Methylococcales bacterium]